MDKPNLFIVGAAKSGTTSLHNYLKQHPDIFMCTPKEPHTLILQEIGRERIPVGIADTNKYEALFLEGKDKKYCGESSVMYLMYPDLVIPKIKSICKDAKIIIMLRNPIERAFSGYQHVKRYNVKENISDFRTAWEISEQRYLKQNDMTPASRYQELGMYYQQVKSFLENFQHVHIIIYDDFKENFQEEMDKVFAFLGLKKIVISATTQHMVGGWQWKNAYIKKWMMQDNLLKSLLKSIIPQKSWRKKLRKKIQENNTHKVPTISQADREMLCNFYKDDVEKLSKLLHRDLTYWTV